MRTLTHDRLWLGAALTTAAGSALWFACLAPAPGTLHEFHRESTNLHSSDYVAQAIKIPERKSTHWEPPTMQRRGEGWIYEVFSPPEIRLDPQTGQFTVLPPGGTETPVATPGLELVAVKRERFRLQLLGYVGGGDKCLGTFENVATSEVILAGPGRALPSLGLAILDFNLRRAPVTMPGGMTSSQWVATAVVRDETTGRVTTLTAGEPSYTETLFAVFATDDGDDDALHELRKGEELRSLEHTYRLERLELDPPTAVVARFSTASTSPLLLTLAPRMPRGPPDTKPAN